MCSCHQFRAKECLLFRNIYYIFVLIAGLFHKFRKIKAVIFTSDFIDKFFQFGKLCQGSTASYFSESHLCEIFVKLIIIEIVPSEYLDSCVPRGFQINQLATGKSEEHSCMIVFACRYKALDISNQHLGREKDNVSSIRKSIHIFSTNPVFIPKVGKQIRYLKGPRILHSFACRPVFQNRIIPHKKGFVRGCLKDENKIICFVPFDLDSELFGPIFRIGTHVS
jgi:hypothetical protein